MSSLGTSTAIALIVGPILAAVLLRRVVCGEPDPVISKLIVAGFVAKLAGTAVHYFYIAEAGGDATRYVRAGRQLAAVIRSGALPDEAREVGTPFMEFLVGVVFSVVGPNEIAGYLVFSMLAFVGMWLFLQAFRLAFPDGDQRRYAALILFLPTMLFWSSSIGKEAWSVFAIGAAAYGAARVLRRRRFGYTTLGVSLAALGAVRPHMALLVAVSFAVAFVLRIRDRDVEQNVASWMVGIIVVVLGLAVVAGHFSDEMGGGESEARSFTDRIVADTDEVFERTDRNTRRGGSEFESQPVRSPVDFLNAAVTVPFRPFLNESHNRSAELASIEGMVLMLLFVLAIPRLIAAGPIALLRKPYVVFAGAYVVGFIIAFSNVGNFGILVRQRAMLLPLLLVFLALPRFGASRASPSDGDEEQLSPASEGATILELEFVLPDTSPNDR